MKKIKILYVISEYKGGNPLHKIAVLGLDRSIFEIKVCYISGQPDDKNSLDQVGMSVYLKMNKNQRLKICLQLARLIRAEKPAILHCHRHKATVYGVIAGIISRNLKNLKIISHVHGLNRTRSWARRLTNFFIYKIVKKIIAVSDSVRIDIIKSNWNLKPEKVFTVRNGISLQLIDNIHVSRTEVRAKLGLSDNAIIFGTVGRLAMTKGHFYLIEAFSEVIKQIPNSRLVIVGDGPLSKELKEKADDLGVSPYVLFTGYRKDVFELLRGFDVFVFPSLAEGLPIALLEAMASRLPVIASNVGGISEVFGHTNCGLLVPPKDSHAFAKAMIEIALLDNEKRKVMGEVARKRVEETFTTEIMCKRLMDVYLAALNTPKL